MADHKLADSVKKKHEPSLAESVKKKYESLVELSSQPCIYKAPDHLREVNEECYQPYVISIGPLHYGCPSLKGMQDNKLRCLKFFLEHKNNSYRLDLERYLGILRELEGSVRDCYAENVTLSSDEFNEMVLFDSAFIICLFMKLHPTLSSLPFLSDMSKRNLLKWEVKLKRDLFLEENQIPFFVPQRLFEEAFGAASPNTSFLDLACRFIGDGDIPVVHGLQIAPTTIERIRNEPKILHLVDLLRKFCFPSTLDEQIEVTSSTNVQFPSSVSNLQAAGVKFVPSKSTNLLDITFSKKGVLEIPPFDLWDVSESYFRSIILFEQSHVPIIKKSYLLHYMVFLEKLIRGPEDVQILGQCGVISNWIGSDETITRLFNGGITKHIPLPVNFCYFGVCRDLNAYANTKWNQWKAILKRDYFSHPWATMSVIYALMLFLLALLQTIGTFTK